MTALQKEHLKKIRLEDKQTAPPDTEPTDHRFTAMLIDISRTLNLESGEEGMTTSPLNIVKYRGQDGKPISNLVRLSPFILLRANSPENPALVLLHELRHYLQYTHNGDLPFDTTEQEIDAYIFTSDVIGAAALSRSTELQTGPTFLVSASYHQGLAAQKIVDGEDIRSLSIDTMEEAVKAINRFN